jgi:hypothetical protein
VGARWVEACERDQTEASVEGLEWKETEAVAVAAGYQEEPEEEEEEEEEVEEVEEEVIPVKTSRKPPRRKRARAVEIPRDEAGNVILPFSIGRLTVTSLGEIKHASHCTKKTLYPIGYQVENERFSYKHPKLKVRYSFQILAGSEENSLVFRVVCGHDVQNPLEGATPSEVCLQVATLLAKANEKEPPKSGKKNCFYLFLFFFIIFFEK